MNGKLLDFWCALQYVQNQVDSQDSSTQYINARTHTEMSMSWHTQDSLGLHMQKNRRNYYPVHPGFYVSAMRSNEVGAHLNQTHKYLQLHWWSVGSSTGPLAVSSQHRALETPKLNIIYRYFGGDLGLQTSKTILYTLLVCVNINNRIS